MNLPWLAVDPSHVTVGAPVYTRDNVRLGRVKEVLGDYFFKVETPLLQRNYWLRLSVVDSAAPAEEVVLSVESAEIPMHRIYAEDVIRRVVARAAERDRAA